MPIDNNLYQEYDLIKSYYNYSDKEFNPFYLGVPSGAFITCACDETFDYDTITKNKLVGFYEIKILSIANRNLEKLGFTKGKNYVLFTSMINVLRLHCKIQFINASYSPSVHIPFTKDFLNKEDGIAHYCKAVGMFQKVNTTIDTNIKIVNTDVDYYSIIKQEGCSYYREQNIIHVSRDNKDVKSYQHIALAIHSYNHTMVLNEMLKYNIDDIFMVKLDSIVIKKDVSLISNSSFKVKDACIESLLKNWGFISEAEKTPTTIIQSINDLDAILSTPMVETNVDSSALDDGICLDSHDVFIDCEELPELALDLSDILSAYIKPSYNKTLFNKSFLYTDEYVTQRVIVIGGKGGTGKTSSLLRNLDPKITCYTTTCWNLIEGQGRKYKDMIGLSLPKLTGDLEGQKVEKWHKG
jgi:hypothetical protein